MFSGQLIFAQLMEFVPRHEFNACVERYRGDYRARGFSCRDQFLCMAFEFRLLVAAATRLVQLTQLAADAGYDSEGNHTFAREEHGIRTIIPAKHGRPTDKLPTGHYRRRM